MRKTLLAFITAIALIFGAPLAATAATNDNSNSKDYSALAAKWWTWVAEQPPATNPLSDTTGAQCANQQSGNVWFLAGLLGNGTNASVTRTCTIPAHTAVFFPLANYVAGYLASDNVPLKDIRAEDAFVKDGASNLYVILDGKAVSPSPIEFENSDAFSLTLAPDNIFGADPGYYYPVADAGYYALLNNLSSGSHVLKFSGTLTFPDGSAQTITVTYNLTISS